MYPAQIETEIEAESPGGGVGNWEGSIPAEDGEAYPAEIPRPDVLQPEAWMLGAMGGRSLAMQQLFSRMKATAPHFRVATVEGEGGTGKLLTAQTLHSLGPAGAGPFAPFTAAEFLESPGTFWQQACKGLLWLSRVDELSGEQQRQLRDFLERAAHERLRLGATGGPLQLVAGASQPLRRLAVAGGFRSDLAGHLTAIRFVLPPLRERREDIPLLAAIFLRRWMKEHGRVLRGFAPGTLARLSAYAWPGNLRELESAISAAAVECPGQWIRPVDLPRLQWAARMEPGAAAEPAAEDANLDRAILHPGAGAVRREQGARGAPARHQPVDVVPAAADGRGRKGTLTGAERGAMQPGKIVAASNRAAFFGSGWQSGIVSLKHCSTIWRRSKVTGKAAGFGPAQAARADISFVQHQHSRVNHLKTGIDGLDDILHGGFPQGHLYLIEGDPGTGKTTLALQFLLEGIRNGETVLYVTLSESTEELQQVAGSHGWNTEGLQIFELIPPEDDLKPEAQYTVFHPSEVELADTIASILQKVDEVGPERLVFDSLAELRMLARDPLKYRRQILALKRHLSGRNITVLMLDDRTSDSNNDLQLQSIAHGVIMMQSIGRDYGINRRRIMVHKLRGSAFREGYHDYVIRSGGLDIFPRLVAAEHKPGFERKPVPSGLTELDALLGGGIDTGTSTLLAGPAGCGKSTTAFHYAYDSAKRGEKAMVFNFDESIGTMLDRMRGLGLNPDPLLADGSLQMRQVDPAELSPGEFISQVRTLVDRQDLRVLIIDSLNGLLNAMPNEQFLALQLHELLSYLGQQGIATIITLAQSGVIGSSMQSPVDVSYLADSILLFRYFERSGEIRQAISVVKKRSGAHERTIRELFMEGGSIRVGEALTEFEGVLTGVPKLVGSPTLREDTAGSRA